VRAADSLWKGLHACPRQVWASAFHAWEVFSEEKLDYRNEKHTILGDRGDPMRIGKRPEECMSEEVFRVFHAAVLHACVENWRNAHAKKQQRRGRDTEATLKRANDIMRHTIRERWRELKRTPTTEKRFQETWILSRAAKWVQGRPEPCILALRRLEEEHKLAPTVIASGDGAGPAPPHHPKAAGWGAVIYDKGQHGTPPTVTLLAGKVERDPKAQAYIGAKEPTNNAGELSAIIHQCEYLRKNTKHTDTVEIQTDSTLAMLAALGATPRSKRGGRKVKNEVLRHKARETYVRLQKYLNYKVRIKKIKAHVGNPWNEVADALAAVGRELENTQENQEPDTEELKDRVRRAIEAEGGGRAPDLRVRGFRWG
jgi:ribonuclease HI